MISEENASLSELSTFGVESSCRRLTYIRSLADLTEALEKDDDILILGGGSNVLLGPYIDKHVLKMDLRGIELLEHSDDRVHVRACAGENWDEFVAWTVERNFGGLENLSLIPGLVGASPMQNIGAYGVELEQSFYSLRALDKNLSRIVEFHKEDCAFGYRDSYFKNEGKGKYVILDVTYELKCLPHELHLDYGAIKQKLSEMQVDQPTISDVRQAVIQIRTSKLPDPNKIGNSGSFFKNPVIDKDLFLSLKERIPSLVFYQMSEDRYKIPAGWMIDYCGWKGTRHGNVGVYKNQALVLINCGGATGQEVWGLAQKIRASVKDTFGIELEPEVNLIGIQH